MKKNKVVMVITIMGSIVGGLAGIIYFQKKSMNKQVMLQERYREYYTVVNQWLLNKNSNKTIENYFKSKQYNSIAIYGMGSMGELLYNEIKDSSIDVGYFIDKNIDSTCSSLYDKEIVRIDEIVNQPKVDVIVITPVFDFENICKELQSGGVEIPMVSLEEVVFKS